MNTYQICDGAGWVLDTVFALDMVEAADMAAKHNCSTTIIDRGPASDRAWMGGFADFIKQKP